MAMSFIFAVLVTQASHDSVWRKITEEHGCEERWEAMVVGAVWEKLAITVSHIPCLFIIPSLCSLLL